MKSIRAIALAAATTLVLAGCIMPPQPQPTTAPPYDPKHSSPAPQPVPPSPSDSPSESPSPSPSDTPTPTPSPSDTPTPSPSPSKSKKSKPKSYPTPKTSPLPTKVADVRRNYKPAQPNSRNALPRKTGDLGVVVKKGTDDTLLLVFRVNAIKSNPECVYSGSRPRNGKLVAIHADFKVYNAIEDSAGAKSVSPADWKAVNAGGNTFSGNVLSSAALNCLREADMLPSRITAGEQAAGMIILDVPKDTRYLIFGDRSVVKGGWEYQLK